MNLENLMNEFADILADKLANKIVTKIDPKDKTIYDDDDLLNTPKAASVLGIKSPNTLRNWTKKGLIAPVYDKNTGKYYYKYSELIRFKKNKK